jgi:hypothetical protein
VGKKAGTQMHVAEVGERDTLLVVDDSYELVVYSLTMDEKLGTIPLSST